MRYLHGSVPGDAEIIDMIRAGVNTVPMMAEKVYGRPPSYELWGAAKSRIVRKVGMLAKYGIVEDAGTLPKTQTKVWRVIE